MIYEATPSSSNSSSNNNNIIIISASASKPSRSYPKSRLRTKTKPKDRAIMMVGGHRINTSQPGSSTGRGSSLKPSSNRKTYGSRHSNNESDWLNGEDLTGVGDVEPSGGSNTRMVRILDRGLVTRYGFGDPFLVEFEKDFKGTRLMREFEESSHAERIKKMEEDDDDDDDDDDYDYDGEEVEVGDGGGEVMMELSEEKMAVEENDPELELEDDDEDEEDEDDEDDVGSGFKSNDLD